MAAAPLVAGSRVRTRPIPFLTDDRNSVAWRTAVAFSEDPDRFAVPLVLIGPAGTGKSLLLDWIEFRARQQDRHPLRMSGKGLSIGFGKETRNRGGVEALARMVGRAPLWILDAAEPLDADRGAVRFAATLLRRRIEAGQPTVVATRRPPGDVASRRLRSLLSCGFAVQVEPGGPKVRAGILERWSRRDGHALGPGLLANLAASRLPLAGAYRLARDGGGGPMDVGGFLEHAGGVLAVGVQDLTGSGRRPTMSACRDLVCAAWMRAGGDPAALGRPLGRTARTVRRAGARAEALAEHDRSIRSALIRCTRGPAGDV